MARALLLFWSLAQTGIVSEAACTGPDCGRRLGIPRCHPGQTWLSQQANNKCFVCICPVSGLHSDRKCNVMPCGSPPDLEETCSVGERFRAWDGCNFCTCPSSGKKGGGGRETDCTTDTCAPTLTTSVLIVETTPTTTPTPTTATTAEPSTDLPWSGSVLTCKAGRKIGHPDKCNTCTCPSSGKFEDASVCTEKRPRKCRQIRNKRCVPGTRFAAPDGCNTCDCPKSGRKKTAKCTDKPSCQADDYYYY
eukprot:TRINITY_DN75194_c0_g1_i1.p1 TRINITY_DN75194_c0_g1~~TRINITY_DN75194_c0_g1_i1.p1  ORF type:complete len:249 (-),score=24.44 TRINITY_DN75194_c0_g1_i1:322-1068(-)